MTTPEKPRPSLDQTLARIDEAIDALAAEMAAQPECRRCARQALIGSELCAYHLQLDPRERMIEDLGPATPVAEPVVRDGNTFTVTTPGVYAFGTDLGRAGLRTVAEASAELLGRERPPAQPPTVVEPERGWLARALHRLFG